MTSTGQIVARGSSSYGGSVTPGQFVLARYTTNGSLDSTFGQGGYVITTVPDGGPENGILLQQPNGDLIVAYADYGSGDGGGVWYLYRFNANGTLDTSFGNQGIVTTTAPGSPEAAVIYPTAGTPQDGQIVLVGQASNGTVQLVRYNANGSLDTTFGTGGFMQTQISENVGQAALDANGRIVATGFGGGYGGSILATELARFNVNGTPDTTFGNGGLVTTTFGTASTGDALAIYPDAGTATDGDIVVVGYSNNGTKDNVLVARYLGQATSPYFVIAGPASITAGTAGTFTISVLNPDGSADTGYSGTVHITSSDPQAVLPTNFTITGGTATFSATLKTAGVQSLTATDTATSGITGGDAGITVNPAAASRFVLSAPSSIKSGKAFSVTLTVEDAYGNVVTGYVGTVHFSSSDSTATLPANYTFTAADAGVYTFTNAAILKKKGTAHSHRHRPGEQRPDCHRRHRRHLSRCRTRGRGEAVLRPGRYACGRSDPHPPDAPSEGDTSLTRQRRAAVLLRCAFRLVSHAEVHQDKAPYRLVLVLEKLRIFGVKARTPRAKAQTSKPSDSIRQPRSTQRRA